MAPTATPADLPIMTQAVLEMSGTYLLMSMEDLTALLPRLAAATRVERNWSNDTFKLSPRNVRTLTVHPLTDGDYAAILMRPPA